MAGSHTAHTDEHTTAGEPEVWDDVIEGSRGFVIQLVHHIDRDVNVTLTPYLWRGEAVLDIAMELHGGVRHLAVSSDRLLLCRRDPHILEHDLEEHIHSLHREAAAHGHATGHDHGAAVPDAALGQLQEPDAVSARAMALDAEKSPAVIASGLHHGIAEQFVPEMTLQQQEALTAHGHETDAPGTPREFDPLDPADRGVIEKTIHLVHHLLEEIEPAATFKFEEYHWRGEMTLDIAVSLGGHLHHYEVSVERAKLFLRDPHMLEHDLEGVIIELRREVAGGAEHHEPAHQA